MADSTSTLQILLQLKDDASAAIAGMGNQTGSTFDNIAGKAKEVGIAMIAAGTAITGFLGLTIDAAGKEQVTQAQMNTTIGNVIDTAKQAADAHSAYSTQVNFLQAKVDAAKASIAFATAELDKHGKITVTTAAAHQKLEASIQSQTATLGKYEEQLNLMKNTLTVSNETVDDVSKQFDKSAIAATNLGFDIADSNKSLTNLFASTHSLTGALNAYQVAQDLARAKGVDLTTATGYVEKAFQGQGRALIDLGINLKDGLSGMQALNAIQDVTKGSAESFSKTEAGAIDIVKAKQEEMMVQIGNQLLPIILDLTQKLSAIITSIQNWADAHPELFKNITELLAILGPGLIILGTLFSSLKMIASGFVLISNAFKFMIALDWAFLGPIAGLLALVVAIKLVADAWVGLQQDEDAANKSAQNLTSTNQKLQDQLNATTDPTKRAQLQSMISNNAAATNDASHQGIHSIGDFLGGITRSITGYASGGIVNKPELAMIGEDGPEAIIPLSAFNKGASLAGTGRGGSGGNIIVNVNGGTYLDSNVARMVGDMIAKSINRTVKLRTI